MKILAFDTAMAACSAAVIEHDGTSVTVLAHHHEARTRGHAEVLMSVIDDVMQTSRLDYDDLDRLAVTVGPGNFTGVRIGIATARGMALALGIPAIGITTLEAIASAAVEHLGAAAGGIAVANDARRGELYVQRFSADLDALVPPRALTPEAALAELTGGDCTIVGTGLDILSNAAPEAALKTAPQCPDQPDAVHIARLAATKKPADAPPHPVYLRAPDAKLPQ
jgi:tRNA threonylcarbamoyl adenosine modification protein YeaZ